MDATKDRAAVGQVNQLWQETAPEPLTIKASGRQDIHKVTTLDELEDVLRTLELPGIAPPHWVVMSTHGDEIAGHGRYVHNEGSKDEWSLTWTTVNDAPEAG